MKLENPITATKNEGALENPDHSSEKRKSKTKKKGRRKNIALRDRTKGTLKLLCNLKQPLPRAMLAVYTVDANSCIESVAFDFGELKLTPAAILLVIHTGQQRLIVGERERRVTGFSLCPFVDLEGSRAAVVASVSQQCDIVPTTEARPAHRCSA